VVRTPAQANVWASVVLSVDPCRLWQTRLGHGRGTRTTPYRLDPAIQNTVLSLCDAESRGMVDHPGGSLLSQALERILLAPLEAQWAQEVKNFSLKALRAAA